MRWHGIKARWRTGWPVDDWHPARRRRPPKSSTSTEGTASVRPRDPLAHPPSSRRTAFDADNRVVRVTDAWPRNGTRLRPSRPRHHSDQRRRRGDPIHVRSSRQRRNPHRREQPPDRIRPRRRQPARVNHRSAALRPPAATRPATESPRPTRAASDPLVPWGARTPPGPYAADYERHVADGRQAGQP